MLETPEPDAPPCARRSYRAFGLSIASDIELFGFEEAPSSFADIAVRLGSVPYEDDGDGGDRVRAYAPGTIRGAVVSGGETLTLALADDAEPEFLSAVVTGELFSVILRQRGHLVLHGSVVQRDGDAVGFVGSSTWGKSTLAAAMVARGWRLVADDVLVIAGLGAGGEAPPTVLPVAPAMRLAAASAAMIGVKTGAPAHSQTSKLQVLQSERFDRSEAPLRAVFYLDPADADVHEAVPMTPSEAVIEATRHTRGRRLLYAPAYRAAHLAQCVDLSRRVPSWTLRRAYGLDLVDGLSELVEATALGGRPT